MASEAPLPPPPRRGGPHRKVGEHDRMENVSTRDRDGVSFDRPDDHPSTGHVTSIVGDEKGKSGRGRHWRRRGDARGGWRGRGWRGRGGRGRGRGVIGKEEEENEEEDERDESCVEGFWDYSASVPNKEKLSQVDTPLEVSTQLDHDVDHIPHPSIVVEIHQSAVETELNRLRLLYSPLVIETSMTTSSKINIRLTIRSTDPDFDSELLPEGLDVRLCYFYKPGDPTSQSVPKTDAIESDIHTDPSSSSSSSSSSKEANALTSSVDSQPSIPPFELTSSIDLMNHKLPISIVETLQAVYRRALRETGSAYQALKHIDRSLVAVFDFAQRVEPDQLREYCRQFGPLEWTNEEQQKYFISLFTDVLLF